MAALLGPPAKKLVPPPIPSLTVVDGKLGCPYAMTVKPDRAAHPLGAALPLSDAGAGLSSAPGFAITFPCGIVAAAVDGAAAIATTMSADRIVSIRQREDTGRSFQSRAGRNRRLWHVGHQS